MLLRLPTLRLLRDPWSGRIHMDMLSNFTENNRPFVPVLGLGPEAYCLDNPIRRVQEKRKDFMPLIG